MKSNKENSFFVAIVFLCCIACIGLLTWMLICKDRSISDLQNRVAVLEQNSKRDALNSSSVVKYSELPETESTRAFDASDVSRNALPAMVSISRIRTSQMQGVKNEIDAETIKSPESNLENIGSGVIFSSNEDEVLVLTNTHVINNSNTLIVTFCDNEKTIAYIKNKTDINTDIATIAVKIADLKSETLNRISCIRFGNSDELVIGEEIVAVGNALGYGQAVTTGVISALNRNIKTGQYDITNGIQFSAGISPGNSGGALLNANGELIGITRAKPSNDFAESVGFAIPINAIKEQLIAFSSGQ